MVPISSIQNSHNVPFTGRTTQIKQIVRPLIGLTLALLAATSLADSPQPPSVPNGFKASEYASDTLLSNPVAISFDNQDRLYVAEAHRKNTGVWGVTFSRWWAMEDYQARTLSDRQSMYERWSHIVSPEQLSRESEIIRVIEDRDKDGIADHSEIFADGFNHPLDGNAAGILALDDRILLTCIPHLWSLPKPNSGPSSSRTSLSKGFGVRVGVHGHDLHGLIQGPDGKIYFSVGDRGFDVTTIEGRRFHESHRGAVFRCHPDGTNLELFHNGLRNPQELAFNNYGDLFTVDNNMSGGDECRILHLLEGADSGWDATFQLSGHFREETQRAVHTKPTWFTEKLWSKPLSGQPHWHNPAIGNLSRGPSGLAHYPGSGFPQIYQDTFFLADFVGSASNSTIINFRLKQSGASYRLEAAEDFASNILATDLEFGSDGNLYVSDWINGWNGMGKGRIWKIEAPEVYKDDPRPKHEESLFIQNFSKLSDKELGHLLGHNDRRIRTRSQFELASRGDAGSAVFIQQLKSPSKHLAQVHALWGMGQQAERQAVSPEALETVIECLTASHPEIRAQAAKVIRQFPIPPDRTSPLIHSVKDPHLRVVYQAMMSVSALRVSGAKQAILDQLQTGISADPAIRHGAVTALAQLFTNTELATFHSNENQWIRECAVLALRRNGSPLIEDFLTDPKPEITYEVIRAIHDLPIQASQEAAAKLIEQELLNEISAPTPIAARIFNLNFRLGQKSHAERLATIASETNLPFAQRLEALEALADWNTHSPFDRVTWHLSKQERTRDSQIGPAIKPSILKTFTEISARPNEGSDKSIRRAQVACARLFIDHNLIDAQAVEELAKLETLPVAIRIAFLKKAIRSDALPIETANRFLADTAPQIQIMAAAFLCRSDQALGWRFFSEAINGNNSQLIQRSLEELSAFKSEKATLILQTALRRGINDALPKAAWLELVRATQERAELSSLLHTFTEDVVSRSNLKSASILLEGGNSSRGEFLFKNHAAQCVRCHQINGFGGKAGPDLSRIGVTLNRDEIVQALINPSLRIAPGFGNVTLDLTDGDTITGNVIIESKLSIRLRLADQSEIDVAKEHIDFMTQQQSSMPPMKDILTNRELRDLVNYLAEQN